MYAFGSISVRYWLYFKTLENISGKTAVECLALFRHILVDVVVSSSFGYRLGAVSKWAMGVEEPLSTAINDFPKRGILVNVYNTPRNFLLANFTHLFLAQYRSDMDVELCLPDT